MPATSPSGVKRTKRKRAVATDAIPDDAPPDGTLPAPLTFDDAPTEWQPLVGMLASCETQLLHILDVDRAILPPRDVARTLLGALALQGVIDQPHPKADAAASLQAKTIADLLPRTGQQLIAPEAMLQERIATFTARACRTSTAALASTRGPTATGETADGAGFADIEGGPPRLRELEEDSGSGAALHAPGAPSGATSFRDSYMALLADGAPDELDALRREEPPMDEVALANLIETLEAGSETFSSVQRPLLQASFNGSESWWAQRGSEAQASHEATGHGEQDGEQDGSAPLLVSRIADLQRKLRLTI